MVVSLDSVVMLNHSLRRVSIVAYAYEAVSRKI